MSVFTIDDVPWGEPRIVQTKRGPRQAREWAIPKNSPFWRLWRTGYLKQQGYTVSKWKGQWIVTQWRMPSGAETDTRVEYEAAQQRDLVQHQFETADDVHLPNALKKRFKKVEQIYADILEETGTDYRYQLPSIKRLAVAVDRYDGGLDASDTGTGKTPVACAVAYILSLDLFVICPKNVMAPWKRMAKRFGVKIIVINYEKLKTGRTPLGHWEFTPARFGRVIRDFIYNLDPDRMLFVFDECHRLKDYRTQNCDMGISAIDQEFKVLALSATAADNPMHMKFIALLTGLIRHPDQFFGWMSENGVKKGRFGMEFVGGRDALSRIHRQIFPVRGSRIRIADLGDRFPHSMIISEAYDMSDIAAEIQRVYDEMHREIAKLEASERRDKGANILVEILRARQRVELLKVPTLVAMARDGIEEGMSVIVILNFEDSVQAVAQRMRALRATITGKDKLADRQALIDRFNDDEQDVLIMNIKAGGLGISLQGRPDSRPRLVLISPTFSGIDLKQALGRAHRAGGAISIQKIVWAADTIEERTCAKVRERMQRVSIFNDDQLDQSLAI